MRSMAMKIKSWVQRRLQISSFSLVMPHSYACTEISREVCLEAVQVWQALVLELV